MKIKALVSYCGNVTMAKGEAREVLDKTAADLISCGYAVSAEEPAEVKTDEAKRGKSEHS